MRVVIDSLRMQLNIGETMTCPNQFQDGGDSRQPKSFRFVQVAERRDFRGKTASITSSVSKDCGLSHRGVGLVIIRNGIRYVSCPCQEVNILNLSAVNIQVSRFSPQPESHIHGIGEAII